VKTWNDLFKAVDEANGFSLCPELEALRSSWGNQPIKFKPGVTFEQLVEAVIPQAKKVRAWAEKNPKEAALYLRAGVSKLNELNKRN